MLEKRSFWFILIAIFWFSCKKNQIIEHKNEKGIVIERYTINGDTSKGKNGRIEIYNEDGKLKEVTDYVNGKQNGERKLYENRALYSTEMLNMDIFEGPYRLYYPSGNIKTEGQYTNNITTGIWKSYYNNGQLKEEVQMAENEENGPFIEYHENGKVKAKGNYLHGPNEQDELLLYDTAGILEKKMDCKEGICKTIWKRDSL